MTITELLRSVRKRWLTSTLILLLALAGGIVLPLLSSPVYVASAKCFVTVRVGDDVGGSIYQGSQFTLTRVKSYTEVIDSPDVLDPVISRLGLDMSVPQLAARVAAKNPQDTVLITVEAHHATARQDIEAALHDLLSLLKEYAGGSATSAILDKDHPALTYTPEE